MFVSLEKHYVTTETRALRAALSDARGVVGQLSADLAYAQRLVMLSADKARAAEDERFTASRAAFLANAELSRVRAEHSAERAGMRESLVTAHRDGSLSLDGLQGALDALGMTPYAEPITETLHFTVTVTLDVEGTDDGEVLDALEDSMRSALEDAAMGTDACLSWDVA